MKSLFVLALLALALTACPGTTVSTEGSADGSTAPAEGTATEGTVAAPEVDVTEVDAAEGTTAPAEDVVAPVEEGTVAPIEGTATVTEGSAEVTEVVEADETVIVIPPVEATEGSAVEKRGDAEKIESAPVYGDHGHDDHECGC